MTERDGYTVQELTTMADEQDVRDALAHPDPSPDLLPAVIDPELLQQEQTVAHLLRASLRLDAEIATLKGKMDDEMEAWSALLSKAQSKREQWRSLCLSWMQRNKVTQIKTPYFTAYINKGKPKIVIADDCDESVIAVLKRLKADKAWKSVEKIVKAEFDAIFNAVPKEFAEKKDEKTGLILQPELAFEKKAEPSLGLRPAKE